MTLIDLNTFFFERESLDSIKDTCLVAVDANVLLALVEHRGIASNACLSTLQGLAEEERLVLPAQALVEYRRNVQNITCTVIDEINVWKSKIPTVQDLFSDSALDRLDEKPKNGWSYRGLQRETELQKAIDSLRKAASDFTDAIGRELLDDYNDKRKGLLSLVDEAIGQIRQINEEPWICAEFKDVIERSLDGNFDDDRVAELTVIAEQRYRQGLPPGYSDAAKDTNAAGDYIIWETLLEAGAAQESDLVFVSNDTKFDWAVSGSQGNVLCPRRELVEEYAAATNGGTFHFLELKQFVDMFLTRPDNVDQTEWEQDVEEFAETPDRDSLENHLLGPREAKLREALEAMNTSKYLRGAIESAGAAFSAPAIDFSNLDFDIPKRVLNVEKLYDAIQEHGTIMDRIARVLGDVRSEDTGPRNQDHEDAEQQDTDS